LEFERFDLARGDWSAQLDRLPDPVLSQRPSWLSFLEQTQGGEPVAALLNDGGRTIGAFAGMIVQKAGLRILGSPFPGWTTPYMGMNLDASVSRREALAALRRFAFGELGCVHLEIMDRRLRLSDAAGLGAHHRMFNTSVVHLRNSPEELIASFSATCGRYIRKAGRDGLRAEEAAPDGFADEYYAQLEDVFGRQKLVPTYGPSRPRLLIESIPAEDLLLVRVRTASGESAATGLFVAVDRELAYFWGVASRRDLMHLHPNELLVYHASNLLRERGFKTVDLGGGGAYKQKYHPTPAPVPWIRISKFPFIPPLREAARLSVAARQIVAGRFRARALAER